jgi:hypothetical protein
VQVLKVLCFDTDLQVFIIKVFSGAAFLINGDDLPSILHKERASSSGKQKKKKIVKSIGFAVSAFVFGCSHAMNFSPGVQVY